MTKKELVKTIATETECTQKDIARIVDATLEAITKGLIADGEVNFAGFGKFVKKDVAAKNVRNPRTNEVIVAPAYKKVTFKPYDALKKAVQ